MSEKKWKINEIFYSIQGEGIRAGTVNVFIRFSDCNLRCSGKQVGEAYQPVCDTEFASGREVSLKEIANWCQTAIQIATGNEDCFDDGGLEASPFWPSPWIILTGGEPALHVDQEFVSYWNDRGVRLAIETNGTIDVSNLYLDWVTVSPKVAEHCIKSLKCDEVKYVRSYGQGIPKTVVQAKHYLISPAFEGGRLDKRTLDWCMKLIRENPTWRLSCQQHNWWGVR